MEICHTWSRLCSLNLIMIIFPPTSFFSFNVAHHCIKGDVIFLSPSSSRHLPRWIASDWSGEQTGSVPAPQASAVCLYGADGSARSHFLHPGALQAGTLRRVDDAFGKCQKTKFQQCFLSLSGHCSRLSSNLVHWVMLQHVNGGSRNWMLTCLWLESW